MYPVSLSLKAKASLHGSDTEKKLAGVLFDEMVQVLSSFELNQLASLTYNSGPCEEMFEMLEQVMAHPLDHSVLCVQKSLVVTKHLALYGAEACVNNAWALGRYVDELREYNTVLMAQKRSGADSFWQRVKGGGVDKGFPVREVAKELHELLQSPDTLQLMRHTHADPNSLVPVGDDKVAFVSDEVRLFMLKKRMEEQQLMHTKSNLAKERSGFGSGYVGKDGKSVVGAAHSVEEMMARAQRETNRYTDDGPPKRSSLAATATAGAASSAPISDLLAFESPPAPAKPAEVDLLDLLSPSEPDPVPQKVSDILGRDDLLAASSNPALVESASVSGAADLLSLMTVGPSPDPSDLTGTGTDEVGNPVSEIYDNIASTASKKSVMTPNADRFAALDALELAGSKTSGTVLSGIEAENRILGTVSSQPLDKTRTCSGAIGEITLSEKNEPSVAYTTSAPVMAPPAVPEIDYSSMSMGTTFGNPIGNDEDDNGFVMGGSRGSGLEPVGLAPAAAPPPPPSF